MVDVHCPNCDKKLAEGLKGELIIYCRGCKAYWKFTDHGVGMYSVRLTTRREPVLNRR